MFRKRHGLIAHLSLSNHHLGKENEQISKYAEVAHCSADFSMLTECLTLCEHFDVLKDIEFPQLLVLKLKEFLGLLQTEDNNV